MIHRPFRDYQRCYLRTALLQVTEQQARSTSANFLTFPVTTPCLSTVFPVLITSQNLLPHLYPQPLCLFQPSSVRSHLQTTVLYCPMIFHTSCTPSDSFAVVYVLILFHQYNNILASTQSLDIRKGEGKWP